MVNKEIIITFVKIGDSSIYHKIRLVKVNSFIRHIMTRMFEFLFYISEFHV